MFGHSVQEWSHESLRGNLAMVSQSPSLFDGSIYENVVYGRADASEAEVIQALKDARLWEFVDALPEKLNTKIGEYGSRLSGGQKQRLSIARAIVKKAKLIILDEPTSALYTQTEYELQTALEALLCNKAAVIIAHRIKTLEHTDYIYCLDEHGKIAEEGTWKELLEREGYFFKINNMQ